MLFNWHTLYAAAVVSPAARSDMSSNVSSLFFLAQCVSRSLSLSDSQCRVAESVVHRPWCIHAAELSPLKAICQQVSK